MGKVGAKLSLTKKKQTLSKFLYKINHHLHCDSKCIVYLLSCKVVSLQFLISFLFIYHQECLIVISYNKEF